MKTIVNNRLIITLFEVEFKSLAFFREIIKMIYSMIFTMESVYNNELNHNLIFISEFLN